LLQSFSSLLDDTRSQFPRLYFVSDEELIEALASAPNHSHQLHAMTRRCFPGILDIGFELADSSHLLTTVSTCHSLAVNCEWLSVLVWVGTLSIGNGHKK